LHLYSTDTTYIEMALVMCDTSKWHFTLVILHIRNQ